MLAAQNMLDALDNLDDDCKIGSISDHDLHDVLSMLGDATPPEELDKLIVRYSDGNIGKLTIN